MPLSPLWVFMAYYRADVTLTVFRYTFSTCQNYITSKVHFVTMFVITDLKTVFLSQCVTTFTMYLAIKFHIFSHSVVISMKLKATDKISQCIHVVNLYKVTQKKGKFWKTQQKFKKSKKKIIDRNWTIKTCLLRDSNANYQCLKITSCRWRHPPRMHSFTVTLCVLHALQNATPSHSAQHATHTGWHKRTGSLKCVVAVKECIRGGERHLQDVIFKHW